MARSERLKVKGLKRMDKCDKQEVSGVTVKEGEGWRLTV